MDSEAPASSQLVEPSTTPIFKMASHCHNLFVMAVGLQFSFHCYDQSFSSPVMFYFPCPVFLFPHLIFCALLCFICSLALVYVSLVFFFGFFSVYSVLVSWFSCVPCDPDLFPMTLWFFLCFQFSGISLLIFCCQIYCCQPFYYLHFTFWILYFSHNY